MRSILLVLICAVAPACGADKKVSAQRLFQQGDRLAGQKKYEEALDCWRRALLSAIPTYRDLPFHEPVGAKMMGREKLKAVLLDEVAKEYPDEELEAESIAYAHFGLCEPGLDLKKLITAVLSDEIAGFYNPEEKSLFLISEPKAPMKKKGFWDALLGTKAFDPAEQRMILCHEMAHALADQHFDLYSLQKSAENDDDMLVALTALIEGEAVMVMMVNEVGAARRDAILKSSGAIAMLMDFVMRLAVPFATGPAFRKAPPIFKEQLLFPYTKGFAFCSAMTRKGGWNAVNAAFRGPPVSTEQIIHPEKYVTAKPDVPVELSFADTSPFREPAWKLVKENVLGELTIDVLFRPKLGSVDSAVAAAGWDGDRFRVYRSLVDGEDLTALVWTTTWDSVKDAREFAAALIRNYAPEDAKPAPAAGPNAVRAWKTEAGVSGVWRQGADVLFLDRIPDGLLGPALAWGRTAKRSPKHFQLKKVVPPAREK